MGHRSHPLVITQIEVNGSLHVDDSHNDTPSPQGPVKRFLASGAHLTGMRKIEVRNGTNC
jgi:hypothetical protein